MPPKARKPDPKKTEPTEDESGIPKNDILFKFSFQVKQNEVADILLMLEWVSGTDTSQREKLDSELIESWNPVNPADPTLLNYELEIPVSYRIDDKFVKNFCKDKFYIHFVSTEDQCVKDTIHLNYSPLLTEKGEQPKFESYHDKIKIPQIESFKVTLSADKELLTPMYKDFLNPLEICIVGAKEMPANNTGYNKYEPVYVQAKFFDGTVIKTQELPHNPTCKWKYKQVIPVGFMDHIKLMEALRTMPLIFEVHDQDELAKNNIKEFKQLIDVKYEEPAPPVEVIDPKAKGKPAAKKPEEPKKDDKAKDAGKGKDAKGKKDVKKKKDTKTFEPIVQQDTREFIRTNYGVSNFNLNDLLNPHLHSLKLRNYIVPIQKYENKDSTNLDLNTTARREVQGAHIACDYITNDSYLVVTFEIAHAIRLFKKPPPPAVPEVPVETQVKGKAAAKPAAAKPITPAGQKGRLPTQEKRPESAAPLPVIEEKPVFERAVYIFPYKSPMHTPKLLSIIQRINMEAFGQADGNPLYITTKALTDDEKRSKQLDIITGLEFIDHEYRTFILEGISDKAMKRLDEEFPKTQPNSKALKILKNPDVKFKERIYADCNIDIKKIRLRENLAKLLIRPEIYLRSKVPEHIYDILISFCELRRCENVKAVVASDLFPNLEDILAMERKYGDALTDEDISGIEGLPQKVITRTVGKMASVSEMGLSGAMTQATNRGMQSKSVAFSKDTSVTGEKPIESATNRNIAHLKTVIDDPKANKYTLHMNKPYPVKEGQEVHTRANTKLNIYEQQKAELREIVRNDPNHFYTYSVNYLSQSIDPYSPDDIKREEEEHKKKMWKTPNGFQTILKKDKKDYMEHPKKPHQSKVDELNTFPWHQDKLEETKKLANSRGDPIRNGVDFKLRIGGIDTFSSPEIVEEEMITAVEKERRVREAKRLAEEEWKKKVVVNNTYFYTSTCTNKSSQLDKIRDIREGDAVKKGIILKDKRLKQTTLGTTKTLQVNPISMYLEHAWEETSNKNLFEREVDLKKTMSDFDFRRNIKLAHQYDGVYKPMKETFPQIATTNKVA